MLKIKSKHGLKTNRHIVTCKLPTNLFLDSYDVFYFTWAGNEQMNGTDSKSAQKS